VGETNLKRGGTSPKEKKESQDLKKKPELLDMCCNKKNPG